MKSALIQLIDGLKADDPQYRGDAPAWIAEQVVERGTAVLGQLSADNEDRMIREFALAAIRFVSDQAGSDCDVLLSHLAALTEVGWVLTPGKETGKCLHELSKSSVMRTGLMPRSFFE